MILINKPGRKPHISREKAQEIVNSYIAEQEIVTLIKHSDIQTYCEKLYKDGLISSLPEISFWRKKNRIGGRIIEATNSILNSQFNYDIQENDRLKLIHILIDAEVDKDLVKIVDKETKYNLNVIEKYEKKIDNLKQKHEELKNENSILKKTNADLEKLIMQVYQDIFDNYPKQTSKLMNNAMTKLFSNPNEFLDLNIKTETNKKQNVISTHFLDKLK